MILHLSTGIEFVKKIMFKRVLIANRGEIALRIIRALREMNIESVSIYSAADKDSLPAILASQSICIGPAKPAESYLNAELIIDIAERMGCDAIHPGYGFLSENASFARKCEERGICFIGPSWRLIEALGDKQSAKQLMIENNVPVIKGSRDIVRSSEEAISVAADIGYPVIVKATAGGGGKGMRIVRAEDELITELSAAQAEAKAAFGNGDCYIEKCIEAPRHIEIQIAADHYGNVVHLGERNCSVQKHHQKLIEEAPAWGLSDKLRNEMGMTAVRAAKAAGYNSVGTVEFILDSNGHYYFMEMNTRIQVEHPVTEMLTGVDLVREQIYIAAGRKLKIKQDDISFDGNVIECRINAKGTGNVKLLHFPAGPGVRIESALYEGCTVTPYYDSMLAKIIVHDHTRLGAIKRMRRCLEELVISGVPTNVNEMYAIMNHPEFVLGNYNTGFCEKNKNVFEKSLL